MRPTQIASLKNYKNSKFSYPKVNRNKSQTKPNFENNSFEKIEKNNPDVICEHRKNDTVILPEHIYEQFSSVRKDISTEKNHEYLATPGFFLDNLENADYSSINNEKNKNGFVNSNLAENRYNENESLYINNIFPNVGVYEKAKGKENNFFDINNNNINKNNFNEMSFMDLIINHKLDFEKINETNDPANKKNVTKIKDNNDKKIQLKKDNKLTKRERLEVLYEQGKMKNEVNRLLAIKNEEIKEQNELSQCTFYPATNREKKFNIGDTKKNHLDGNFYERLANWQNKIEQKNKNIPIKPKDHEDCTYKPSITEKNLENVFSNKSVLNDPNSRGYLIRLEKARRENEEKIKRVYWNSRGSLNKKKNSYSKSTLNILTTKEDNASNSTLNLEEINKTPNYLNLQNFQKTLREELNNIDGLAIDSESDEEN